MDHITVLVSMVCTLKFVVYYVVRSTTCSYGKVCHLRLMIIGRVQLHVKLAIGLTLYFTLPLSSVY